MHTLARRLFKLCEENTGCFSKISSNALKWSTFKWKIPACNLSIVPPQNEQDFILQEVSKGDKEIEHKLKVLILEMELLRQEGQMVPENHEMKVKHYSELLKLYSRSARKRYLEYLFKICRKHENRLRKKEEKALELKKRKEMIAPKDIPLEQFVQCHDLQHNNLFLRFRDKTVNNMYNNKLIQAMKFGQKLIIDCGYYNKMTERENSNCSKQVMLLFGENRIHDDPFDLHLCNFDKNSSFAQSLARRIATLYDPEFPLNVHEQNYLKLFPKKNLVYLTPHCKETMEEYDHDALYIVGAIVDKMNQEPLSMAKAKQENVRMLKLPLDKYLLWSGGSGKSLTLNQVVSILLDIKSTGNWEYALRHVPRRKLAILGENQIENVTRNLLKQKQRWSSTSESLNRLSFNRRSKGEMRKWENKNTNVSVTSLFTE